MAAALELSPGETMVDLGCGRGEVGMWIADHLDVTGLASIPLPVGLEIAGQHANSRRTVVEGHFLATGLEDDVADAVLVLDALHFATQLEATFAEIGRILRPGRRLVLVGPQLVDPRAALTEAGFVIERDEQSADWRDTLGRFLALAHAEADALRSELGEQPANDILARDLSQLTEAGHGLIVARS